MTDRDEGGQAGRAEGSANWKRLLRTPQFLIWSLISITWLGALCIFLPSLGSQVNVEILSIYFLSGLVIAAFALLLPHWVAHDFLTSLGTAAPIGAIFIAIFALFGYLISAQREARRLFLEKQLEACAQIAETVGTLATESDRYLWNSAYQKFWANRWGRLSMFEDPVLENNMVEFNDILWWSAYSPADHVDLHQPALCVARTCRAQAQVAWSVVPGLVSSGLNDDASCDNLHSYFRKFCKKFINDAHHECEKLKL